MNNRTVVAFVAGVLLTPLQASAAFVGWPGLTDPDVTITFDTFTDDDVLDDQLLSLGVDFNGQFRVRGFSNLPNMSGAVLQSGLNVNLVDTYDIDFLTPVSAAGFFLNTKVGFTTFTALLSGQVVESHRSLLTSDFDSTNFYGFEGITFDRISFTITAAQDSSFHLDDLQYSAAAVPEPSTLVLVGAGALIAAARRRKRIAG